MHNRLLRDVLRAETWRRERIVNYFRFAIMTTVGLAEWHGRSGFEHPHLGGMPFVFLGWGVTIGVLNATALRRHFRSWFPAAITTIDIVVVTVGILLVYDHAVLYGEQAPREIERAFIGMFVLLSVNAIRFSWRTTLWSGACAVAALGYLRVHSETLGQTAVGTDLVAIGGFVALLVYANRTVREVTERLLVDLRRAQERRLASLRSLVAGVTHEVNSPLGAIDGNAQTVERATRVLEEQTEAPIAGEVRRALEAVRQSNDSTRSAVARMSSIVRTLGDFARLDGAEVVRADLRRALDSCLDLLASDIGEDVEVDRRYDDLPAIECQPAQINQALMHVLRNAVQAIDGPGRITVDGSREGDWAVVTIADTGRGIPPHRLKDIFELQLGSKGSRVGMGLGLPIAQSIVRDHAGTIDMSSTVGRGTTVTIRLPVG